MQGPDGIFRGVARNHPRNSEGRDCHSDGFYSGAFQCVRTPADILIARIDPGADGAHGGQSVDQARTPAKSRSERFPEAWLVMQVVPRDGANRRRER